MKGVAMNVSDSPPTSDPLDMTYRERPPWDIGQPQPALMALLDEYPPAGPVLEVGCGTGELALALAQRGLAVLGVDLAQAALLQARAKAAAATPEVGGLVEFRLGDARHPASLPGPFGAVVDSGFFHLLGPLERERFVIELADTLITGGRYYLLGFAFESPLPNAPRAVTDDDLRTLFTAERGWRVLALRPERFLIRSARGNEVPAVAACFERT
jgi:SAM-dependent methyltransferase